MREILFRGKTEDNKWIYGVPLTEIINGFTKTTVIAQNVEIETEVDFDGWFNYEEVYPETIGQFTGLTDKNGTKIFEGDILQGFDDYSCFNGYHYLLFTPEWDSQVGSFMLKTYINPRYKLKKNIPIWMRYFRMQRDMIGLECKEMEIIGNIHDNPLIKN